MSVWDYNKEKIDRLLLDRWDYLPEPSCQRQKYRDIVNEAIDAYNSYVRGFTSLRELVKIVLLSEDKLRSLLDSFVDVKKYIEDIELIKKNVDAIELDRRND